MSKRSSKPAPLVTRESLQALINAAQLTDDQRRLSAIVGKACVAIFERQTDAEKRSNDTQVDNGIGFSGADAIGGSLTAKSYLKYGSLKPWQIEKWTAIQRTGFSRICKYAAQLNEIALEKQARKEGLTELERARQEYGSAVESDDPAIIRPAEERLRAVESRLGVKPYNILGAH